ncbi:hypothetical protein ACFOUP_11460 [Belliella kenyensis]|uniref:Uncharacterized protein n=1 Tax=Belliella kenyensis TaxID=1472724 RepID=A0ABV8EKZ6_9BACT|nr:hypothetical protein [Belliella kenyensis]MCH7400579.1 hypothetical protein [Belliella kenyensis]MDN3602134.1 hypothetical protein [Belliella kenyensis]
MNYSLTFEESKQISYDESLIKIKRTMSNTASISTEIQKAGAFAFQNISRARRSESTAVSVIGMLEMCGMLDVVESSSFDFPNFPEAKKQFHVVYFTINESFSSLRGLFRGLTSLGKPGEVILENDASKGLFTLKYYQSNERKVKSYLATLIETVENELRFKQILNQIIENQRKIKAEQSLLLQKLFA